MPLLAFFKSDPDVVHAMPPAQVVSICGNGRLTDGSECSEELKHYLRQADSARIIQFLDQCLVGFDQSGSVLQDVVNEIGRRFEFRVENGRYQGKKGEIGFDGKWELPNNHTIVLEVKTTDVYAINLDTIATYREKLIDAQTITRKSSILMVVGRQDTNSLEAQIRGSRHAWDMRMISVDGLKKLLAVKEQGEETTAQKISEILIPVDYTKLDRIVDIVFAAATDIQESAELPESPVGSQAGSTTQKAGDYKFDFTPTMEIEAVKQRLISTFTKTHEVALVRKSRSCYWSPDEEHLSRFICTVSKTYPDGGHWFAYHPGWDAFLAPGLPAIFALGLVGKGFAFFIPREWMAAQLSSLGQSGSGDKAYWHIVIRYVDGVPMLVRRDGQSPLPLSTFRVELD